MRNASTTRTSVAVDVFLYDGVFDDIPPNGGSEDVRVVFAGIGVGFGRCGCVVPYHNGVPDVDIYPEEDRGHRPDTMYPPRACTNHPYTPSKMLKVLKS